MFPQSTAAILRRGFGARPYSPHRLESTASSFASFETDVPPPQTASAQVCACPSPPCGRCHYLSSDRSHALHPYSSMTSPLPTYPVSSASGVHLTLEDGRRLIDGMSSWWAVLHGYRHPALDAALRAQVDKMSHVMFGGLTHRPAADLCQRLVDLTPAPLTKAFLADSGSVSVEVAMKMAVQYWATVMPSDGCHDPAHGGGGSSRKAKFVSLRRGYHGDTFGAMSVCDPVTGMHSLFSGILAEQIFVDAPDGPTVEAAVRSARSVDEALAEHGGEVAAVILEPVVQGAGGMRFFHPHLLKLVRESCDRHGVLLIFDEIATGFGRTGSMFACEHSSESFRPWYSTMPIGGWQDEVEPQGGRRTAAAPEDGDGDDDKDQAVVPDILCLGKALTGGYMTMGATLTTDRVAEGISSGGGVFMHGPTFMGNPLASAVSLASLDLLTDGLWRRRVRDVEEALVKAVAPAAKLDAVREVRVLGAIGVCELREPVKDMAAVQRALVEEGVWLRPFGRLLYTMPTFNCPDLKPEHMEKIGSAIRNVASQC